MTDLVCSLAGTAFVVSVRDDGLLESLERTLALYRVAGVEAPVFHCTVESGEPNGVPAGARVHYEGTPPLADGPCVLGESAAERFLIFPGRISLFASLAERRATLVVHPGEAGVSGFLLMHLIDWVLEADGKTLVHGAAFADPAARRGILVFAPSGAGKTTLALALLRGGFRLYSDDLAVLFRRADGEPMIAGLPRAMKVHRNTLALMPWLAPHLGPDWDPAGEQPLAPAIAARIGPLQDEPVPLAAVLRLAGRGTEDHALSRTPPVETLMALAAENVRMGATGAPDFERRTFRRLGTVLSKVATYDLVVGRPLDDAAGAIADAVA